MVAYSDELCHWAKGSVGKNHKYLKREWKNGRWRYDQTRKSFHQIAFLNHSFLLHRWK